MYLGLDCGTSGLKALLVDEARRGGRERLARLSAGPPAPGWSEQDPDVWRQAMAGAIADLRASAPEALAALKAIGFSGQMHGAVLIDRSTARSGRRSCTTTAAPTRRRPSSPATFPISPASSASSRCRASPDRSSCGSRATSPSFRAGSIACWRPKDYLRLALTGERGTDMSDAAGQWLLDEAARRWSAEAIAACGAEPALGAAVCTKARTRSGSCARRRPKNSACRKASWSPRAAATPRSAPWGSAPSRPGEAFISLGTATQLIVATERYLSAPEKLVHSFAHALPGRWYAMAAMLNGAGALAFAARLLGAYARRARTRGGGRLSGPGRAALPALSFRRADAARRPLRAGRAVRHERDDVARRRRPRGHGGRGADARRGARQPRRRGRLDRPRAA